MSADYYLAEKNRRVVRMTQMALGAKAADVQIEIIDLKDRRNFGANPYLSKQLIDAINDNAFAPKNRL